MRKSDIVPTTSVVVKDLRLKDKDKDLMSKDEDLKIGPRGSSRTRTFLEDNNTADNPLIVTIIPLIASADRL